MLVVCLSHAESRFSGFRLLLFGSMTRSGPQMVPHVSSCLWALGGVSILAVCGISRDKRIAWFSRTPEGRNGRYWNPMESLKQKTTWQSWHATSLVQVDLSQQEGDKGLQSACHVSATPLALPGLARLTDSPHFYHERPWGSRLLTCL